ncbi:DNA polymerase Y family protein [Microbacterium sp. zg.Y1084]|uniref:DNA polymerase Y family protein n=1 Tax=Microbacterium sp. zg.Y1084 TaxID=2969667 RepID=UPI00214C0021|nr:DNA polymerase Y family protein [Microbacterium sp. zg.Y1084]MCR2812878.1 DNA polymerase Y family protein [Microbacterium sp. zg.Y1084]
MSTAPDTPVPRTLVLWLPDWPVVALAREAGVDAAAPVAVLAKGAVVACSAAARAEGVRRGQRRRDAQARCPQLTVADADPTRDQRVFAPLIARIEELAPGVQLLRAGLCALRARGPARYYGGEERAAHTLRDAMGETDTRIAIADGPFTAEQAARRTLADAPVRIVPAGESAAFLAPLPITALDEPDIVDLLGRLGVQTLGQFAALPAERVGERLGERGIRLHALAAGRDSRPVQPRTPPPDLDREVAFEPPLEIADQVAFAMRVAAEEFIGALGALDLVCTELRVQITGDRAENSERVWLHPGAFTAGEVVDRVRWQLGEAGLRSAVTRVRIAPETVDAAAHHVRSLFGGGPDERVHHALSRVQAMLGHRGVVTPVVGGGRWLSERQVLVPWGDRPVVPRPRERPWPGSLPDPLPSTVFDPPLPVAVVDADGDTVAVGDRDALTAPPAVLVESGRRRRIDAWAGPWPVRERGWDAARARQAHRFQVVDADQSAWLLVCEAGDWSAEGRYD